MDDTAPPAIATLTDRLLEATAPVAQIIDHMSRAPGACDAGAIVDDARAILADALAPLSREFSPRDLRVAGAVFSRATEAIVAEILLVPHDAPEAG